MAVAEPGRSCDSGDLARHTLTEYLLGTRCFMLFNSHDGSWEAGSVMNSLYR